ncbi:MAG: TolC family protein, partial [Polyangiales bacterium]
MSAAVRLGLVVLSLLAPAIAAANEDRGPPLGFEEVLQSVTSHDPRIRQAVQRVRKAEGNATAARGAFDPRLEGNAKLLTGAYYDNRSADAELRQPTTLWGSEIFVGYRVGRGINQRWPTYRDDQTLSGGEVRAGIEVPVWRGGLIDPERAERARTMKLEEAAEQDLSVTELDLELGAAQAYWNWVSTGRNRYVAMELLDLAEQRDAQLRRRFEAGSIAQFDVTDNERILLERRTYVVEAERAFEKASFELSLYLRDDKGEPVVVGADRIPHDVAIQPVDDLAVERVIEKVVMCHPEVRQARALLDASEVDQLLARNRLAPEIDARFAYSRDLGELTGTDLDFTLPGNVFEAGVQLSIPLLMRTDRGRATAARAVVAENLEKVRFVEDQLRARTLDAASAVEAAQE